MSIKRAWPSFFYINVTNFLTKITIPIINVDIVSAIVNFVK